MNEVRPNGTVKTSEVPGSTWEATAELAWVRRGGWPSTLCQVWRCREDGKREYRPVETQETDE